MEPDHNPLEEKVPYGQHRAISLSIILYDFISCRIILNHSTGKMLRAYIWASGFSANKKLRFWPVQTRNQAQPFEHAILSPTTLMMSPKKRT